MNKNIQNGIKPLARLSGNQWNWNETDPVKLKQMSNSVVTVDEVAVSKTESNQQENATPANEESVKAEQEDTILSNNDAPTQVPAAPQKTISLDMQAVNDIFDGLRAKPTYALVRVKLMEGCLNIKARMWFGDKTDREYESPANYKLINLIMRVMDGNVIDIPYEFKQEENRWAYYNNDADPRVEVFDKFMQSSLKCHIEKDFIPEDGIRRTCVTFTISKGMEFKFCLERTEEIEKIINRRIGKA